MTLVSTRILTTALFVTTTLTGCATTIDSRSLGVQTTLASDAREPAIGERFEINKTAVYMFWGLTQPGKASIKSVLGGQAQGEDKIADLTIKVRTKFKDVLVSILTLGIVVTRSVSYEGVIVRGGGNQ